MDNRADERVIGAEVYEVLRNVPKKEYYKIPRKITSIFEKYKNYKIETKIDFNKSFEKQEISKQAKEIIFCISLNYWLTEKEKQETLKKLQVNEKEFNEKYSVEKLFKQNIKEDSKVQQESPNMYLEKCEEKWYTKVFIKIKKFLKGILKK